MNLYRLLACFILFASVLLPAVAETTPTQLTRAADVRALKASTANSHNPVHLSGVVLLPPTPGGDSFVVSDESAAIYCEFLPKVRIDMKRGDKVTIVGRSKLGGFAPYVKVAEIQVQGTAAILPAVAVTFDQMASGSFDSQPVEVTGIVRRSEKPLLPEYSSTTWMLELATGGGRLKVLFRDPRSGRHPVDTEIRVSGICFYQFSKSGQIINPLLVIPTGVKAEVVRPSPAEVPVRQIDRLMPFASDGLFGHRVRVRGVVTYHLPGEGFWMEENGQGLLVIPPEGIIFSTGEAVEVTGFPAAGNYSPVLEDVTVKRLAAGVIAPPSELKSSSEAPDHDAGLIRLDATLVEQVRVPLGLRMIFRDAHGEFTAHLRTENSAKIQPVWETDSRMRVTGICRVSKPSAGTAPGTLIARDFELILRSPTDLEILHAPPWWNARRMAYLLAITTLTLGLVVGFILWLARRRLRQSVAARRQSEAEFSAILAERNRIAREIHDTLAQGLGAISLHLELVIGQVPAGSDAALHLAEASGLTRESMREARNSIWNMRSQVLETHDLAGALASVLDQLTEIEGIESRFLVTGTPYRLSPVTENNLLRIGQEAIANAVKHSDAAHIEVDVSFSPNHLRLQVIDDGRGFELEKSPPEGHHFGLVGLHERAKELGAALRLESSPGQGTKVVLDFPNSQAKI
ncbi:MAG: sensor histidine kinase [Akkermansiaceae bacterium]